MPLGFGHGRTHFLERRYRTYKGKAAYAAFEMMSKVISMLRVQNTKIALRLSRPRFRLSGDRLVCVALVVPMPHNSSCTYP